MQTRSLLLALFGICSLSTAAFAQTAPPESHAPIGVMGDHIHEAGEWMLSYRFMQMKMQGNVQGNQDITTDQLVSSIANRFANPPVMPPTLRVAPLDMTSSMHMLGLMYAPSDRITLMAMLNLVDKEMQHLTYMGAAGTTRLGYFETSTDGLGDTKLGLLYSLLDGMDHKVHLNFGLSIPTGAIEETGRILTPMNTTPSPRLPYAMQLGSGTYDFEPGLTYRGYAGRIGWGSQLKYLMRLDDNDEGYSLGDQLTLSGWSSYRFNEHVSGSLRLTFTDLDSIDGIDSRIILPVQTADPDNQGGQRWDLGLGINTIIGGGHRFSLEYENTLDNDVNGVQLDMDSMITLGYQFAF